MEFLDLSTMVTDKKPLVGNHLHGCEMAEVEQRLCGEYVVVGLMAVLPFQMQYFKQMPQFVLSQPWADKSYIFQCVDNIW